MVVHLGESSEDGVVENASRAAAGTVLTKNICGKLYGGSHFLSPFHRPRLTRLKDFGSVALDTHFRAG
jgi:hypothetical protein